jgi:response regulator RpfG family c-di-GMP phosphodiesterase
VTLRVDPGTAVVQSVSAKYSDNNQENVMANVQLLTNPHIEDQEALIEFAEALSDRAPIIEQDMAKLSLAPTDRAVISDLFRSIHNIKGDASLCKVEMANQVAHPIESLLTRLRANDVSYTPLFGEVILLAVDRLELATEALVARKSVSHLRLAALVDGLEQMSKANQAQLDSTAAQVIETVTGFRPRASLPGSFGKLSAHVAASDLKTADLEFFLSLALQFETHSPLFKGRTGRILELARETNCAADSPVDVVQLEAAVYMHDVGMMFLPDDAWLKPGWMSPQNRRLLHIHPGLGAGLLERMDGWREAARMVREHHETPDGAGYPQGLTADRICPGAKILAIVDAFESVTLKHSARGHKRSILRAIAEVNACGNQFAPEWIEPFNAIIRRRVEE